MAPRILVIEDSNEIQEILQMTLQFNGYNVEGASNGLEGLKAVESRGPFDLIICDLDMPVMSGVEFIRRYRTERPEPTPIIVLTAEMGEAVNEAMAVGANQSIYKPFEPIRLLEEIQKRVGPTSP